MGCNCGKKSQDFKAAVQQAKQVSITPTTVSMPAPLPSPIQPVIIPPAVPRISRKERRRLRAERIARRNAAKEARVAQANQIPPKV